MVKSATFPSLRVEPEPRDAAESLLWEGVTLACLIETSMREAIHRRRAQDEFITRGLRCSEEARRSGEYHSAESVIAELQLTLDERRKKVLG